MFAIPSLNRFLILSAVIASTASTTQGQPKIPDDYKVGGFAIGCQAYSFNGYKDGGFKGFSVFEAIEKTAKAGGKVIEFYPGQSLSPDEPTVRFSHDSPPEVIQKVKEKLTKHGVKAVNYGVVGVPKDEAAARKVFEFAKTMGMRAITTEDTGSINTIEKLVKEYDLCVGFHNHPGSTAKPDYKVWNPLFIAGVLTGRDPRIGAAADTGHWCTSNIKPIEGLKILKGRIISVHLKDKKEFGPSHDVPYGEGVADIKACLDELKAQGFEGNISIEYEHNWENSLPEITKCIDFVRNYPGNK